MKKGYSISMWAAGAVMALVLAGCCCGCRCMSSQCDDDGSCGKSSCGKQKKCDKQKQCNDPVKYNAMRRRALTEGCQCKCVGCKTGAKQCASAPGTRCEVCEFFGCTDIKPTPDAKKACCYLIVGEEMIVPESAVAGGTKSCPKKSSSSNCPMMQSANATNNSMPMMQSANTANNSMPMMQSANTANNSMPMMQNAPPAATPAAGTAQ